MHCNTMTNQTVFANWSLEITENIIQDRAGHRERLC